MSNFLKGLKYDEKKTRQDAVRRKCAQVSLHAEVRRVAKHLRIADLYELRRVSSAMIEKGDGESRGPRQIHQRGQSGTKRRNGEA